MELSFIELLKKDGWSEVKHDWLYTKEKFRLQRDTSSWWILLEEENRIFDIAEPATYQRAWMINLINYLCRINQSYWQ